MDNVAFVADVGSGSIKAELAGADGPRIIANVVGQLKHKPVVPTVTAQTIVAGDDVTHCRGLLKLFSPMEHGHVKDWERMNLVLQQAASQVGVSFRDHPVLMTEAPYSSRQQRQRFAQILFEEMQVPSLLFAVQGVLSLYASGHTTGVVLDVGEGVTQCCAVVEGYSLKEAARRIDFGGRDVTTFLQMQLRQAGTFLDTSSELEIVREIKEQRCSVSSRRDEDGSRSSNIRHTLPDGHEITLSIDAMYAPDVMFNPAMGGFEQPGVVSVVQDTIRRCDIDLRQRLFETIFLAGGSTLTTKFSDRFLADFARVTPHNSKIRVHAPAERRLTAWTGASFLAQLPAFAAMATKRSEYMDQGERILNARLFA